MTRAVRTNHWRQPEFDAQSPGLHHRWCVLIPAISTEQVMALEDDITTLAVLVQGILDESGDQTGCDAKVWLDGGLTGVVPALERRRPLDVLNEPEGLEVVKSLLLRAQSGAYS